MTASPSSAPTLASQLDVAVGRATVIDLDAQAQLTGESGTLTTQLCRLQDALGTELRTLLAVPNDLHLPPRRALPWTLLTEHENPVWPVLALSRPPTLSALTASRIVRHLATSHMPMDIGPCRAWAQSPDHREGTEAVLLGLAGPQEPTWGALLAAILSVQAHHIMLHSWGVLAALVGLTPALRLEAATAVLAALHRDPGLTGRPAELAAETLWAGLSLLHGGLPRPDTSEVVRLAAAMRTLPERTQGGPLPELRPLIAQLAELLPGQTLGQRRELAESLSLMRPADPHEATSGIVAWRQPGQSAIWLRRAGEVQLIVCRAQDEGGPLDVLAWRWRLPARGGL